MMLQLERSLLMMVFLLQVRYRSRHLRRCAKDLFFAAIGVDCIEVALNRSESFKELESIFPAVLFETGEFATAASEFAIVALKSIAAYRGGLDLELVAEKLRLKTSLGRSLRL